LTAASEAPPAGPQSGSSSLSPPLSRVVSLAGAVVATVIAGHSLTDALAGIEAQVRPAVMDLAYGTVRSLARNRFFLRELLTRGSVKPDVEGVLLCALQALQSRPGAEHMVVDQSVQAVSSLRRGAATGLANAVLRNFLRRRDALLAAAEQDEEARYNYPAWWIARVKSAYPEAWQALLATGNQHPPMTLRVNRRRGDTESYLAELGTAGLPAHMIAGGALMLERPVPVEHLPGFAEGRVSVQDLGAQLAAPLLDVANGMRVLDACAAPGGKTGHLLELAELDLTAVDIDADRLARVKANLERLQFGAARLLAADCAAPDMAWWDGRPFDRILLDAPCSASGVARRHPDAKWLRRETDLASLAARQSQLLETLWRMLGRGGKLLYATCSVFPEENADRIANFLERHRDARLTQHPDNGQLMPDSNHDGFFYALLGKEP
jgi:16S rRNA (cytosine967-C5)-methyltransferase